MSTQQETPKYFSNPVLLLIITIILIFWAEAFVMIIISALPPLTIITEAFVDALLLSIIAVPIFYFFLLRPIQHLIRERNLIEDELGDHRLHLEEIVKRRTEELGKINDRLEKEITSRKNIKVDIKEKLNTLERYINETNNSELMVQKLRKEIENIKSDLVRDKE
jgi:C4-dicarboxylate-specific signal transduction histidine kinase